MPCLLEGMLVVSVEQALAARACFEDERPAGREPPVGEHTAGMRTGFEP
jgi:hypothetical protein